MLYSHLREARYSKARTDIVASIRKIREGARRDLPARSPETMLLGTWNIREFGGNKYGGRQPEALFCIAEIISHFDLVAIQELRPDLSEIETVMRFLGREWEIIYSDVSYASGGNSERMAFLWDTRKVRFNRLAGQLVLGKVETQQMSQLARTPFICGFQSGWARFNLCSVHMYYGTSTADDPRRVAEIDEMSKLLNKKAGDYIKLGNQYRSYSPENLVLLGDFNIFSRDDATFAAMTKNGFIVPEKLAKQELGSNVKQDRFYDQIAFYKGMRDISNVAAGIFDFYKYIYTDADADRHVAAGNLEADQRFHDWRTYQMSDHLIMWAQFDVDKSEEYLDSLVS